VQDHALVLGPAKRIAAAVARFMLASLAAIAVIVVGGFFALREVAIDEAERDTRERVQTEARLVETAGLTEGILRADRDAIRRLDDLVLGQIVTGSVVRVRVQGTCGRGATSELRLRAGDGAIRVEFEVRTHRRGERWRVVLVHERRVVWRGRARASGGRAFRVRRYLRDLEGADRVTARASGPRGNACEAGALLRGD
jgi:hypothetical protein